MFKHRFGLLTHDQQMQQKLFFLLKWLLFSLWGNHRTSWLFRWALLFLFCWFSGSWSPVWKPAAVGVASDFSGNSLKKLILCTSGDFSAVCAGETFPSNAATCCRRSSNGLTVMNPIENVDCYLDGWWDCLTIALIGWRVAEEWGCSDTCCFVCNESLNSHCS